MGCICTAIGLAVINIGWDCKRWVWREKSHIPISLLPFECEKGEVEEGKVEKVTEEAGDWNSTEPRGVENFKERMINSKRGLREFEEIEKTILDSAGGEITVIIIVLTKH